MFAAVIALFFAGAAAFAVLSILKSFSGGAERIDALFAQYRASETARPARGVMLPPVRFVPAPAPKPAAGKIIVLPRRAGGQGQVTAPAWRAAA